MSGRIRSISLKSWNAWRHATRTFRSNSLRSVAACLNATGTVNSVLYRSAMSYTNDNIFPVCTNPNPAEYPADTIAAWHRPYRHAFAADSARFAGLADAQSVWS